MRIILKQDVEKLGFLGDELTVNPGYARNFLLPTGKAIQVNERNVRHVEYQRRLLAKKREEAILKNRSLAERLQSAELVFTMKAGENGKLFGSVSARQIMAALEEQEINLERKHLQLSTALKTLGTHVIPVKLHSVVSSEVSVKIITEEPVVEQQEAPTEETKTD